MDCIYWFLLSVLLIGIELSTMTLTTIWFAAGSLAAFLIAFMGGGIVAQMTGLIFVSFVSLCLTRPLAVKYLNSRIQKTNVEELIGKLAVVVKDIDNSKGISGQVSVNGQIWSARGMNNKEVLSQGEQVEILQISGVTLLVRKHISSYLTV